MTQYVAIDLNHCPRLHIRCIATRENKNELQLPIQIEMANGWFMPTDHHHQQQQQQREEEK
ncbi:hypothetical protein BLOT_013516 [Blomia tropicalis]|nr:hypothetical protein BLOT_013516 [Blomia tropicalis]